jgi:hypothetical protein
MQKSEVGITFEALSNSSELRSENCSTILIILFQIVIVLIKTICFIILLNIRYSYINKHY